VVVAERGTPGTAKRPRDRKAQIAEAAAGLFREQGYHRVGIEDIAASVGITGRAIYRHFANKHDLLAHVVVEGVTRLEATVAEHAGDSLAELIEAVAAVMLDARYLGVLMQREARHLNHDEQQELAALIDGVVARIAAMVRVDRRELDGPDADLLVRSAIAVLASPSYHAVVVPKPTGDALLAGMASAVLASHAVPRVTTGAPAVELDELPTAERASRREAVLAVAIELFARHGYAGVRMEDVGAAAGITGPSVYQHFAGKADLLMAVLNRGAEWLQLGLAQAFSAGGDPAESLRLVARSYIDFLLWHTDLMSVFLTETIHLPDDDRHAIRRVQHEYVSEWVRLLDATRPELSSAEARFVVQGAVALVNDIVHRPERGRTDIDEILLQLTLEVMGL